MKAGRREKGRGKRRNSRFLFSSSLHTPVPELGTLSGKLINFAQF